MVKTGSRHLLGHFRKKKLPPPPPSPIHFFFPLPGKKKNSGRVVYYSIISIISIDEN